MRSDRVVDRAADRVVDRVVDNAVQTPGSSEEDVSSGVDVDVQILVVSQHVLNQIDVFLVVDSTL